MIVSHNELVACVYKAFLGMRRQCGEADIVANMVADLQMVGLNGIHYFNQASLRLNLDNDCAAKIVNDTKEECEIDLNNGSIACHLPAILDFILEKMVACKQVRIKINRCHDRWLAYSELLRLSAKGISCRVEWFSLNEALHVQYILNRGCIAPDIFFVEKNTTDEQNEVDFQQGKSMMIELSTSCLSAEKAEGSNLRQISNTTLIERRKQSLEEGIYVADGDWEQLKQAASIFLVENSEHSSRGAGGLV